MNTMIPALLFILVATLGVNAALKAPRHEPAARQVASFVDEAPRFDWVHNKAAF